MVFKKNWNLAESSNQLTPIGQFSFDKAVWCTMQIEEW